MWTEAHRARYGARLKEIGSLNAVAEVARWLERVDPPRSGRATPYGAVVRAGAPHLRIGGAVRWVPPRRARRRPGGGAARPSPAVAQGVWLVWQAVRAGAVQPLPGRRQRPPISPAG